MWRVRPLIFVRVDVLVGLGDVGGGLDRLGVGDRRVRAGRAAGLLASLGAQRIVNLRGDALVFPSGIVGVDSLPGREVMGQVPPLRPGAVDVQDRVHDAAHRSSDRSLGYAACYLSYQAKRASLA
jgi:hypothetical protein